MAAKEEERTTAITVATRLHLNGNDGLHPQPFTSCYIGCDNMNMGILIGPG